MASELRIDMAVSRDAFDKAFFCQGVECEYGGMTHALMVTAVLSAKANGSYDRDLEEGWDWTKEARSMRKAAESHARYELERAGANGWPIAFEWTEPGLIPFPEILGTGRLRATASPPSKP